MANDQNLRSETECPDRHDPNLAESYTVTAGPRGLRASPGRLESAARASLALSAGRVFTDLEWARARVRLLEFAVILRAWDQKAATSASGLGDGDAILSCKPPP